MEFYDTLKPFKILPHTGIQYSVCRPFDHISRYKGLRQVAHNIITSDRFTSLETPNPFETDSDVIYYDVPAHQENRLDIIANDLLGSATYSWVIAYFNNIEDGFTVQEGQRLKIPKNFTSLFNSGELLQTTSPLALNLSTE